MGSFVKIAVHGWINFYKESGPSSTKASSQVRHLLKAKKAGHAGTLDPFACGLLPIALGEATKLIPYLMEGDKTYQAIIRFGACTTTQDNQGDIVHTSNIIPTLAQIYAVIPRFTGTITQTPSPYSAIKINGERAYKKARMGDDVAMPSRQVSIHNITVIEQCGDTDFLCEISCGSGTYIRTLAHDIGLACGTYGHLIMLKRTKVGIFDSDNAFSLEKITYLYNKGQRQEFLLPMTAALNGILVLEVGAEQAKMLRYGHKVSLLGLLPIKVLKNMPADTNIIACFKQQPIAITAYNNGYLSIKRGFTYI